MCWARFLRNSPFISPLPPPPPPPPSLDRPCTRPQGISGVLLLVAMCVEDSPLRLAVRRIEYRDLNFENIVRE